MAVDCLVMGTKKKIQKRLNIPLSSARMGKREANGMVVNLKRRMHTHIIRTEGKEDGEGGHKDPKNNSLRIAEFGCILGSPLLKRYL